MVLHCVMPFLKMFCTNRHISFKRVLLCLVAVLFFGYSSGQGIRTDFGKSVIQYKDFDWYFFHTENFDVYFYSGGKELAEYTLTQGEKYLKDVETKLDFPLGERITFIIYDSYNDFRQSNFNAPDNDQTTNIAGTSKSLHNVSFIYYNGTHFDFSTQIKKGIAKIIMNEILYGGNLQERVQNNVLLNTPDWYIDGLVEYIGENWNAEYENRLKSGFLSGKFKKFKKLSTDEQLLIGHSLWKYINDEYGESAVANIIYIMRANKSVETGYLFVLGKTFNEVYDEWFKHEYARLSKETGSSPAGEELVKLHKVFKKGRVTQWDISRNGDYAAVVTNDIGLIKVWIVDIATGKKKVVFKSGYRRRGTFDYTYPLIGWNPKSDQLTVIYERRSEPTYFHYNMDEKNPHKRKSDPQMINHIDRVLSFQYADNGKTAVFSAVHRGQSDIFTFDFHSQALRELTDDIYDDIEPHFVHGSKGIVFTSNRPSASLAHIGANRKYEFNDNYDIFYFPNYTANRYKIVRLSQGTANETSAYDYDSTYFSYLTDENGIVNRAAVKRDSFFDYIMTVALYKDSSRKSDTLYFFQNSKAAIQLGNIPKDTDLVKIDTFSVYKDSLYTYTLTDRDENIEDYKITHKPNISYEFYHEKDKYALYKLTLPANPPSVAVPVGNGANYGEKKKPENENKSKMEDAEPGNPDRAKREGNSINQQAQNTVAQTNKAKKDTVKAPPKPAYFQSGFEVPANTTTENNEQAGDGSVVNTLLNNISKPSNLIRFPSPSPYFLDFTFDQLTTQLDNGIITTPYLPYNPNNTAIIQPTIQGLIQLGVKDMFRDYSITGGFSVNASLTGASYMIAYENLKKRLDKKITFFRTGETDNYDGVSSYRLTSDQLQLELKYPFTEISSLSGSVFGRLDRTVFLTGEESTLEMPDSNRMWTGGKLQYVYDNTINFAQNLYYGVRGKAYSELYEQVNSRGTYFQTFGVDVRSYTKISRQIIWANRFAAATSIGTAKIVYFLGGVDDWLFPQYNQNNYVDQSQNYAYEALATPVRGFIQNVRNGSSYAVINSELRIPLIKYIVNRPLNNSFADNFMALGFFDAGSAWNGLDPFSLENAYNKTIYNQVPFIITVTSLRNPIVYGYGFGIRDILLGYYLKLDFAWGVDDGVTGSEITYLSMGYDF